MDCEWGIAGKGFVWQETGAEGLACGADLFKKN
jgi:hypothetical protein